MEPIVNTRTQSTTEFSPFELVFGRQANPFNNWKNIPPMDEFNNLIIRIEQIKHLINNTHPLAIERIKEKQEVQKVVQNSRHEVTTTPL